MMFRLGVLRCRQGAVIASTKGASLRAMRSSHPRRVMPGDLSPTCSSGVAATTFSTQASEEETSKRRQFKQIVVDPKVMRHLDALGLGMEKKKVERGRKLRLYKRGAVTSAVPGAPTGVEKPKTFEHPTWAVKRMSSVTALEEVPPPEAHLPEVALVGRSNVGKSTLVNALLGLQGHPQHRASVSETPGETRTLDFFQLGKGKRAKLILADMPGYGFAYAHEGQREDWKGLMMAYLRGRGAPLKRVMLLLDARHGFKKLDMEFLELLYDPKGPSPLGKYRPPKIQILLTKCDLVKRIDLARRVTLVRRQLDEVSRRQTNLSTMMLSALKGRGLHELQQELASLDPNPSTNGSTPGVASASGRDSSQSSEEAQSAAGSK